MNMQAMNQSAGGPVGGGMMMMNNGGSPAMPGGAVSGVDPLKQMLNTYIYEYFLKNGHFDIARALVKDDKVEMRTQPKQSPGRRKDGEMNGDTDPMDMDLKDDIPDDLPRPTVADSGREGMGFLFEWFAIFSDIFAAHRSQGKAAGSQMNPATQYLLQHQQSQRIRENMQNQNLGRPGMMPNHMAAMRMNQLRNNMTNGDMRKGFTPQQIAMLKQSQQAQQGNQQMPRGDQPDGDPNARPPTPAEGDNGGSPSKRPRLEGQQFNAQLMANGARQAVPGGNQQNMMIQNGFNPMAQAQFRQNGNMPPKMPAGMANGMMNMPNPGSPMMAAMNQFSAEGMPTDMYNNRMAGQVMQGAPNGQSGNHALQDYQMQLMLLEQQNKKRLMMARQEQHEGRPGDGHPMPGGGMPSGISPSGSRSGTSPNPTDQMKRTPQMGGMPGSPSAGDMQVRSPAAMNFMNGVGGMGQDFNAAMFMKDGQGMMGPGPGMRPPTSSDINAMNRQQQQQQQQQRMVNQYQGGQPMVQQPSQGQPQPVGTPGQRNEMPPPSAPTANNSAQRNNQPASPANSNAPPTPSQSNKPNPKNKKGKDEGNKKRPQKKNSMANAPSSEDAPAATPITPQQANGFNGPNIKGPAAQQQNQQPHPAQVMPPNQQQMPGQDLGQNNTFNDNFAPDQNFNLDFSTLENSDVLENFDFDSFLNTSADDAFTFDSGMVENFSMDATGD